MARAAFTACRVTSFVRSFVAVARVRPSAIANAVMCLQAVQNAMKALGFLSPDGEQCTTVNQAYLCAGVKPGLE